jgi:hypothetical protein
MSELKEDEERSRRILRVFEDSNGLDIMCRKPERGGKLIEQLLASFTV